MKRIVILVVLVAIAAVAGAVRSSVGSVSELRELVSHQNTGNVRQEIRETYQLARPAKVGKFHGFPGAHCRCFGVKQAREARKQNRPKNGPPQPLRQSPPEQQESLCVSYFRPQMG